MTSVNVIWIGFAGSFFASLGTAGGALGALLIRRLSPALEDGLLSGAAGIMLAATLFSLLLPALELAELQTGQPVPAVTIVIASLLIGALSLHLVHQHVPHEHFSTGREGPENNAVGRMWLFVLAITLHNFPEGMAVGTGFAGGDMGNGLALALGIGLQNVPEGLAVAVALMSAGYTRARACAIGVLTGFAEPIGGLFGSIAVSIAAALTPWAMGFAAGAMLYIISHEIIPETHRGNYANLATFSLIGGFVILMFMDAVLN